uniref:Regulator of G-protein signaling 1 n=1 Tax=Sander lucioperca TaxID=283035 RepID=A0A8C9YBY8_SANLU
SVSSHFTQNGSNCNNYYNCTQLGLKVNYYCFCSLCAAGQLVFEDFLRTEYSEENLLFWLACEDYRKITSKTKMTVAAKRIYTEFVQVDAPRQINIDCVTREEISENISQPEPNCFDRAQRLIYGLMENDCYPRFLKSEIYQKTRLTLSSERLTFVWKSRPQESNVHHLRAQISHLYH